MPEKNEQSKFFAGLERLSINFSSFGGAVDEDISMKTCAKMKNSLAFHTGARHFGVRQLRWATSSGWKSCQVKPASQKQGYIPPKMKYFIFFTGKNSSKSRFCILWHRKK